MLLTLPNILTIMRIVCIPLVLASMYIDTETSRWVALAFYVLATITDLFDGYLARLTGKISLIGRFLDPVADKLLVVAVILGLLSLGPTVGGLGKWNGLAGFVIVFREIIVLGLREYLAEVRIALPVSRLAKWKTTFQFFALGFLIVGQGAEKLPWHIPAHFIGIAILWISALLTLLTGYQYLHYSFLHMIKPQEDNRFLRKSERNQE